MGRVSWPELPAPRSDRPRVVLDLVPIEAGQGGGGGGIWRYASMLARAMDALDPTDMELIVLTNPRQRLGLDHAREVVVPVDTRSRMGRLRWIHRQLPALCGRYQVAALHKLATEVPWWRPPCRLVTTMHDFMADHYADRYAAPAYAPGGRAQDKAAPARRSVGRRLHDSYFRAIVRRCFETSDALITGSHAVVREAERRFPGSAGRMDVVYHGVTPSPQDGRPSEHRDHVDGAPSGSPTPNWDGSTRLLTVGALLPHKGHHSALHAAAALAALSPGDDSSVVLTIHGHAPDASYERYLRAIADHLSSSVTTSFRRYDESLDGRELYAGADVLLQLSSYEGFGLPPLEAQAAGVPVVCNDIPVFREVLGDGAIFVDRENPREVAESVRRILRDGDVRGMLVERGRTNAAKYTWQRSARRTLDVYRGVLGLAPAIIG